MQNQKAHTEATSGNNVKEDITTIAIPPCFKPTAVEMPHVEPNSFTIEVYFICEEKLYKGEYHMNGFFYAYKICGYFDCMASAKSSYKDWFGTTQKIKICTHWCYVNELKISN